MKNRKPKEIVYSIEIGDIQDVAEEVLGRHLSRREVDSVARSLGDHIDWFQAIWNAMLTEKIYE